VTVDAVLIAGPTCAGKTALALALAERFPVEIVSVDSAQVYRGMDVGTAKPSAAMRAKVPHHLIDICDPAEPYSAGRFRRDALEAIAAIRSRGRVALLVGGTLLYFRALTRGLAPLPEANPELRFRIDARAQREGWPALHAELAARDPDLAARIRPADGQRIQRALEVMELTGRRLSELQRQADPPPLRFAAFALVPPDRAALYARIDDRVNSMMAEGFLAEVAALRARGDLSADLPSLRAVGYRQLWTHLEGAYSREAAVAACQRATRNLAKRQLTWLRSEAGWQRLQGVGDQELKPLVEVFGRVTADGMQANVC
jgi:tRNA dimethylallyltransferase